MPGRPPDSESEVRFLSREEGGRKGPARQGLHRPDIHVDDDPPDMLWMICPRSLDDKGAELAAFQPLRNSAEMIEDSDYALDIRNTPC